MQRIRQLLAAPVFEDEEKTRSAELVNTILISVSLLISIALLSILLGGQGLAGQIGAAIVIIVVLQVLRFPLQRGYVRAVAVTIVVVFTLAVTIALGSGGTVRAPGVVMLVLASIIAGLTIGRRAAYWSAAINSLIIFGLIWAEINGVLPPANDLTSIQLGVIFAVAAVMTAILLNQAIRTVEVSLELAKVNQNKLTNLTLELEQQVEDRTRALQTSTEVSRRLSTILSQQQLVREVVEQLQSAFGYYHAHIYLYDAAKQNLEMAGGTGDAGRTMLARGHKIEKGRGLVGRAAETNEAVLIPDVSKAVGWLPNPLLPDTKAEVAVPIAIGPEVLGVLDVQHNVIGGLSGQDADLIQAIANQVGIAVQNAQAYERAQRQAVREAQVASINQRIQAATTIDDVLKIAVSELGGALGARRSDIELNPSVPAEDGRS